MESYVSGTGGTPLLYRTIGAAFDEIVARYPDREALVAVHQDIRWSHSELAEQVDAVAAGLFSLGLEVGERIGIWAPNCAEWVVTQLATAKLGLILVNINPANRLFELEYALNKVGCKALILAERLKTSDYIAMIRELAPEIANSAPGELKSERLPDLRHVIAITQSDQPGMYRFADLSAMGEAADWARIDARSESLSPDQAINIQFTSGTTGSPKGATLTHQNILNNGFFVAEGMKLTHEDRLCIPVPLYHCFGMVLGVLGCITHGAAMIFPGESFDPLGVLQCVEAERCTALFGVPTMFIAELEHPAFSKFDLSTLRTGMMAGAPCPVEVMRRVISEMHMREVTIGYGMTETSPVSFQTHPDDPVEKRVSTVGRVLPFVEVKIVDGEGRMLPRGQQGELLTRGYSVMQGYWADDDKTAESIDEAGWMHSGDLATIDEEGYGAIVGRVKDMIIRGGENIYPREIEEFLLTHPGVREAAVFGVPDKKYGEQVSAWIQVRNDHPLCAKDIKQFCGNQIAHFKVPYYVKFVDEFPMTVTGKIQKFQMRDTMVQDLNAGPDAFV